MNEPKNFQERVVSTLKEKGMLVPTAFLVAFLMDILFLYGLIYSPENSCLAIIGIGALTPFVFIWFRITDAKKLFVYITVLFLIFAPVYAALFSQAVYDSNPMLESSNGSLRNGTVTPHTWNGGIHSFNFTVDVSPQYVSNASYNYTVYVNITDSNTGKWINESMNDHGNEYYKVLNLSKGVYYFYFLIKKEGPNATYWNYTDRYSGAVPAMMINMDLGEVVMNVLPMAFGATFLNLALLSYILLGMYWWTQIAKQKKKEMVTVRKSEEGESVRCPVCGNKIPKGAEKCPYCGAELIYDKEQEEEKSDGEQEEEDGKVEGNEPEDSEG